MSKKIGLFCLAFTTVSLLSSCTPDSNNQTAPQLLPQGGKETLPISDDTHPKTLSEIQLQPILDIGKRAVTWLNLVNQNRNIQSRLNLADRTTKNPVPPEKPKVNSVKLLLQKLDERLKIMPDAMKPYLVGQGTLVEIPPVNDDAFIKSIREMNGLYQSAIRLLGQIEWFDYYAEQDVRDIRGYYFFTKEPAAVTELETFSALTDDKKIKYSEWLVGICHNSKISKADCKSELDLAIAQNQASGFYNKYVDQAKIVYDNFFKVKKMRTDLIWSTDGLTLTQDFILPTLTKITTWLQTNVEEEWKATGFQLLIKFVPQNSVSPFLVFEKGITPHVSGATWNSITMDPDYSLEDYDTQWTIRHEFGHVLGFPDCYLEFYDQDKAEMIYYTIEPDNLMCAWGGKLQPSHVDELKRVYQ
ncbi:MAG: hypothetical protein H7328_06095 [Bdellovibrio sp.]|nr:hypothetical protein [Bdellovibrio sp.]